VTYRLTDDDIRLLRSQMTTWRFAAPDYDGDPAVAYWLKECTEKTRAFMVAMLDELEERRALNAHQD